jgi:predicted CXXCH cytochrome family protein
MGRGASGILRKDTDCSSGHGKRISGKSVHSAMLTSCDACHVAKTQGDMTTLNLAMPGEQFCFSCHEKSAELRQHVPVVKGPRVDCPPCPQQRPTKVAATVGRTVAFGPKTTQTYLKF